MMLRNVRQSKFSAAHGQHVLEFLLLLLLICHSHLVPSSSHETGPKVPCKRGQGLKLEANFLPGTITVDAKAEDWDGVAGQAFSLLPALSEDAKDQYPHGAGTVYVKSAHDGHFLYFLLEVAGPYMFQPGDPHGWPSVALMFGVGDDATYHSMGGCEEQPCTSDICAGHEVDILQFELSRAIPGRMYGGNLADNLNGTGADSVGDLNDMYAWSPHCVSVDGTGLDGVPVPGSGSQNEWQGSWSHSSIQNEYGLVASEFPFAPSGTDGNYLFEFARPLRTMDRLQQDVQFSIGKEHRFAVAFWYPLDGNAWRGSAHYSGSCDWIPLTLHPAGHETGQVSSGIGFALGLVSTFVALIALAISFAVGRWWLKSKNRGEFNSLEPL